MDFRSNEEVRASDDIREEKMLFVQSQYSASPKMLHILSTFRDEMNVRSDYLLFYKMIFNVYTAQGIGLDIIGRIVGIERTIEDVQTGFAITLEDEYYRQLILYKALSNIMQSTIPALTKLIKMLFPGVKAYVITIEDYVQNDDGVFYNRRPMYIRWVFKKFFSNLELAVFKVAGTLCRGGGVGWHLYTIDTKEVFGFDGSELLPFNQGIFDPIGLVKGD